MTLQLSPDKAILIPIDMQEGFDLSPAGGSNNPHAATNGLRLLAAWRDTGLPVIHVRHDSVAPGSRFAPGQSGNALRAGFEPRAGEVLVTKSVNAAFIGTDLDLRLRRLGIEQVVLFGMITDMCVSTTARVAANLGYRVVVVGDACTSFDLPDADGSLLPAELIHRAHLATLRAEFGQVAEVDEVVAAITVA